MTLDIKHILESHCYQTQLCQVRKHWCQLVVVSETPLAESVALADTEGNGVKIPQDPAWLLDTTTQPGAGDLLSAAHGTETQPQVAQSSFWEQQTAKGQG